MNIRKWKDSPALKETRDMLETKLEDKKVRGILNWIFQIAVVLIFGILAGIALFQSVTVQESAMEPTLQVGERFFVNRAVYKVSSPERGDIIVYKTSGSDDAALHIGRVIGLPGETVQISNGAVLINGEVYNENKNFPEISNAGLASDGVSLESGEYFVLGDNRNNSEDSRYGDIGNINKKYIVGKVWFVISPKDKFGFLKTAAKGKLKEFVLYDAEWYEVYDFIEVNLSFLTAGEKKERAGQYNEILEQEKAGYRIVLNEITPITNDAEIETIEQAATTPYDSVNQHISKALAHYADLKNPDYENSVKEAISAVEAMCCIITGTSGKQATLGNAIKKLEDKGVHIHGGMKQGFKDLYGYASDENGIRHGGKDFKSVPPEDAKFMLISCSAFVNYLIEKWSKVENN